jgi:hypothetical protein
MAAKEKTPVKTSATKIDGLTPEQAREMQKQYANRFSILKRAQEYNRKEEIGKSMELYLQYLKYVSDFHKTEEKKLKPSMFDPKKDMAELLLISHVYWDIARAYDRSPRLEAELKRCLQQFLLFSIGFKYQYLNSEMMRRFIRKKMCYNQKLFEDTYKQLRVHAKSCYIATYVYPDQDPKLETLRQFRDHCLNKSLWGRYFIAFYYAYSPIFLSFLDRLPLFFQKSFHHVMTKFLDKIIKQLH